MISIFIADDEKIEIDYISKLVLDCPDKFILAGTCLNSLELLDKLSKSKPDLLILDIRMPHLDGISLAEKIKATWPEIIIILNSAYAEFEYAQKAIDLGIDSYLLKPSSKDDIISTIMRCVVRSRPELLLDEMPESDKSLKRPTELIKDYIDRHYREKISLQMLAKYVHFNPSYLSKLFSQQEGISIHTYITEKRMEYAANTLRNTDLPIKLIAQECGYDTISQFYRSFKSYFGCTPIEYRNGEKK